MIYQREWRDCWAFLSHQHVSCEPVEKCPGYCGSERFDSLCQKCADDSGEDVPCSADRHVWVSCPVEFDPCGICNNVDIPFEDHCGGCFSCELTGCFLTEL